MWVAKLSLCLCLASCLSLCPLVHTPCHTLTFKYFISMWVFRVRAQLQSSQVSLSSLPFLCVFALLLLFPSALWCTDLVTPELYEFVGSIVTYRVTERLRTFSVPAQFFLLCVLLSLSLPCFFSFPLSIGVHTFPHLSLMNWSQV